MVNQSSKNIGSNCSSCLLYRSNGDGYWLIINRGTFYDHIELTGYEWDEWDVKWKKPHLKVDLSSYFDLKSVKIHREVTRLLWKGVCKNLSKFILEYGQFSKYS